MALQAGPEVGNLGPGDLGATVWNVGKGRGRVPGLGNHFQNCKLWLPKTWDSSWAAWSPAPLGDLGND